MMIALHRMVLVLTVALGGTAPASPAPFDNSQRDAPSGLAAAQKAAVEEIRRLRAADVAATKSFDVDALAALWADDVVAMAPGREPVVGKAANLAVLRTMKKQAAGVSVIDYRQDWRELRIVNDHAFEWGMFSSVFRTADGTLVKQRQNVLRVLRREHDGWKVARTLWNASPEPDSK